MKPLATLFLAAAAVASITIAATARDTAPAPRIERVHDDANKQVKDE